MFHRITNRAPSSASLQSKSMGSSEELSHSSTGTYSSPDNDVCKYSSSFSSKSSGMLVVNPVEVSKAVVIKGFHDVHMVNLF